ncbi:hypothetical protein ACFLV5_02455 [Chloroflexota bacterium]
MRKGRFSNYEQETIIIFNKGEAVAYIFTYEKTWQQHLEKRLGLKPIMDNGYGGKEYAIEKKRIRPPRAPLRLSAEARSELGRRLNQSRVLSAPKHSTSINQTAPTKSKGKSISQQVKGTK